MDITRKRGDTYPIQFQVLSNAAPMALSGESFLLTVDPEKAPTSNANNIFQLTGLIIDAPNGLIAFNPSAGDVDYVGKFYYDVQMTDGAGKIRTIVAGAFKLVQDITKV